MEPMIRRLAFLLALAASSGAAASHALLLVSIDGMRPDALLEADAHGLKIPHLRRILAEGTHATGVRGVLPTVTGHDTLPTVRPACAAASQRVGTAMSSAYQYQPSKFLPSGSKVTLE